MLLRGYGIILFVVVALSLEALSSAHKAARRLLGIWAAKVHTITRWLRDGLSGPMVISVSVMVAVVCRWLASLLRMEVAIITIVTVDLAALLLVCCARGRWHGMQHHVSIIFTRC